MRRGRRTGTGAAQLLYSGLVARLITPWDWSRDGRFIVFGQTRVGIAPRVDVWALPVSGREAFPVLESRFVKHAARVSPDGRYLAYSTDETGTFILYSDGPQRVDVVANGRTRRLRMGGLLAGDPVGSATVVSM